MAHPGVAEVLSTTSLYTEFQDSATYFLRYNLGIVTIFVIIYNLTLATFSQGNYVEILLPFVRILFLHRLLRHASY